MKQLPEERNKPDNYMLSMVSIALMGRICAFIRERSPIRRSGLGFGRFVHALRGRTGVRWISISGEKHKDVRFKQN
jgi:hypothetical protein